MSKIVLLAINAKYVHTSLSVWVLASGIAKFARKAHDVIVRETTINQNDDEIIEQIIEHNPDVVGISTYIWNAKRLPGLIKRIRNELPQSAIILGGPEASNNVEYWLNNGADFIQIGEGEYSLPAFLDAYDDKKDIQRIIYPDSYDFSNPSMNIDPYNESYFNAQKGRIAYIETSRGCPFSCAFCLSGDAPLKFLPVSFAKERIMRLAKSDTNTIKFVDRTFNCNANRTYELLKFIIELQTECCFHFEVAVDLFDKKTLTLLKNAPPGRIQLEAGLQSMHEPTLTASSRKSDLEKAKENIQTILEGGNIHLHLDLIAGLPYEDLETFVRGFNQVYNMKAHTLQLGFLKLLPGSKLREKADDYGICFDSKPPYEILHNTWVDSEALGILKIAENALNHTHNKGRFLSVLEYVTEATKLEPFELFLMLGNHVQNKMMSLDVYAEHLYRFFVTLPNIDDNTLKDKMTCDWLQMVKGKNMPSFLKRKDDKRKVIAKIAREQTEHEILRDETAVLLSGVGIYVDSYNRDKVTGLYKLHTVNV